MNIQAIGNFYQNNLVKRNNATFGQGSLIVGAYGSYNPRKDAVDTTAFSTKRKLTDIEICNRMLKAEKGRFTQKETVDLEKSLGMFLSKTKKAPLLKKLLDIKTEHSEKLSSDDIIGFLYVTDEATSNERDALITMVKYELDVYNEQNERIFVPLENHPEMFGHLNNINKKFKHLPEYNRGQLLSMTFDIIQDSKFMYKNLSTDIATKMNMDKSGYVYQILYKAAQRLNSSNNDLQNKYNKVKFVKLLNSFTPKKLQKISEETAEHSFSNQARSYIENYLSQYDI